MTSILNISKDLPNGPGVFQRLCKVFSKHFQSLRFRILIQMQSCSDNVEVLLRVQLRQAGGNHEGQQANDQVRSPADG